MVATGDVCAVYAIQARKWWSTDWFAGREPRLGRISCTCFYTT